MQLKILLAIGAGSFIGGIIRYLITYGIQDRVLTAFPYGTICVNLTGCFLIGLLYGISEKTGLAPEIRLFFATGLLGGFTTFSTFSGETVAMLRDGQYLFAGAYVGGSVVLGLALTLTGLMLAKIL